MRHISRLGAFRLLMDSEKNLTTPGEGLTLPRANPMRVPLWGVIAMAAALVFVGGPAVRGISDNGLRYGSQLAWRFACVVYFAAIVGGPVTRLLPFLSAYRSGKDNRQLLWGFCASFGVFLASILVPNTFVLPSPGREGFTVGMGLFVLFGAGLTMVVAYAAVPHRNLNEGARRTILGAGLSYFWAAYALTALSRLSGPHRPDMFYGISLILMVTALLLRFADRFVAKRKAHVPAEMDAA